MGAFTKGRVRAKGVLIEFLFLFWQFNCFLLHFNQNLENGKSVLKANALALPVAAVRTAEGSQRLRTVREVGLEVTRSLVL